VVDIEGVVEEANAFDIHGGDDGLDDFGAAAFRKVGNAFDERVWHAGSRFRRDWPRAMIRGLLEAWLVPL
jgi:hypothetical protein